MSRHSSGLQYRSPTPRVLDARVALERLHIVLDATDPALADLVHAARTFWITLVFALDELQEEEPVFWPYVDDEDLDRLAGIAAHHYQSVVAPLFDFGASARGSRDQARIRDAIGEVIDALDRHVVREAEETAHAG